MFSRLARRTEWRASRRFALAARQWHAAGRLVAEADQSGGAQDNGPEKEILFGPVVALSKVVAGAIFDLTVGLAYSVLTPWPSDRCPKKLNVARLMSYCTVATWPSA